MPLGPAQQYLAQYNTYQLPGYVQNESFDSEMNIADHYAPYADGSLSEYTGLANKNLSLTLKVWEQDYATCKDQTQLAATMLRSKRGGFADLYLQDVDRHYEAMVKTIQTEKAAGELVKTLDYQVGFECKPWLINDALETITGTGTVTTDTVGRTIADGGWSPVRIDVSGTNVTVSGYTINGDFAGYMSSTGAVTNLIVDSDAFTATIGGVNQNDIMLWSDYRLYVGPEKTFFVITGASACSITYHNRWYL
jgi:hypothetical protein